MYKVIYSLKDGETYYKLVSEMLIDENVMQLCVENIHGSMINNVVHFDDCNFVSIDGDCIKFTKLSKNNCLTLSLKEADDLAWIVNDYMNEYNIPNDNKAAVNKLQKFLNDNLGAITKV